MCWTSLHELLTAPPHVYRSPPTHSCRNPQFHTRSSTCSPQKPCVASQASHSAKHAANSACFTTWTGQVCAPFMQASKTPRQPVPGGFGACGGDSGTVAVELCFCG